MTYDLASLQAGISGVRATPLSGKLARVVQLHGLESIDPHEWLYLSGRAYRYNLGGANCIYFSETRDVAQLEYDSYWRGLPGEYQPVATYYADISVARVLDLTDAAILTQLAIDRKDLFIPWRTAKRPTLTQLIGTAVLNTNYFSAIRYPSNAAEAIGKPGNNVVIFRDSIRKPDFVCIVGPRGKTLQEWP